MGRLYIPRECLKALKIFLKTKTAKTAKTAHIAGIVITPKLVRFSVDRFSSYAL
jgi:hypothetical protein